MIILPMFIPSYAGYKTWTCKCKRFRGAHLLLITSSLVSCVHVTSAKHSSVWKLSDVWRLFDEIVLVHGPHGYNIECVHVLQEQCTNN